MTMTREECVEAAGGDDDDELLFADGFDEAILGVAQRFNDTFVVYDKQKVLAIMVERDGMTHQEAMEFFDFNIVGAFVGPRTPAFMDVSL